MRLQNHTPTQALNKAYRKQSIGRTDMERFKTALKTAFRQIDEQQDEEYHKNIISQVLHDVYYKNDYIVNVNKRQDLVIRQGNKTDDPVGVILEFKKPSNTHEMINLEQPNAKALHEIILYYLRETIDRQNHQIKHVIITNIWQWYLFDGVWFEKNIYRHAKLRQDYQEFKTSGHDTRYFYEQIAAPFLNELDEDIPCTFFDLHDYQTIITNADFQDDDKLIDLYKILSPAHLLKQPFANDSNTLNKEFYNELLHLIGLIETKDGGKKIIQRPAEGQRHDGSLLENAINKLQVTNCLTRVKNIEQYGENVDEQLFSVGLELCLKWINRILFLKLLEGQLIKYHNGDRRHTFLNRERISDFDELEELFFEVLAVPIAQRSPSVREKFGDIPYLNSSLFEIDELEDAAIRISALKDRLELPLYAKTVLKNSDGKPITGRKATLYYLFEFLDAYDFASDSNASIQEQNKSMINASVLGLIFEKINGYKDGSFFTPGFITMYMCREILRRAVVQKFNEAMRWNCADFADLRDKIDYADRDARQQANAIINSLKICDPAVGSGHFLVSALNELIAIKSDLKILCDRSGQRLKGYAITIENDELIVTDTEDDRIFEYRLNRNGNPIDELQSVQEALFHEKQTLIENCLFGVDINPKSVMICRLRLWIELLKNAYYVTQTQTSQVFKTCEVSDTGVDPKGFRKPVGSGRQLETLPNIDINIKCGNSLVSRFAIDSALEQSKGTTIGQQKYIKQLMDNYKLVVSGYKNVTDKTQKDSFRRQIESIKTQLEASIPPHDRDFIELDRKEKELGLALSDMFEQETQIKLAEEVTALKARIADKMKTIYRHTLEWRFEFPEVLDDDGNFIGFDVVIGNPPYIPLEDLTLPHREFFKNKYKCFERKYETSVMFIFDGLQLLSNGGALSFIAPVTWQTGENYVKFREFLLKECGIHKIINLPFDIFVDAYVETAIYAIEKKCRKSYFIKTFDKKSKVESLFGIEFIEIDINVLMPPKRKIVDNTFFNKILKRFTDESFVNLGEITKSTQGLSGSNFASVDPSVTKEEDLFPFLASGNVYNYSLIIERVYSTSLADKESLKQFYRAEPKILIRRIVNRQDRLSVGYTDERMVFKKDVNPFIPIDSDYSAKFLLAIMASRFISFLYINSSTIATKDDFRQTTLTELREIPIPRCNEEQQKLFEVKVTQILSAKAANPAADTTALEREIDHMVYRLYGLTPAEIKIVEGK